MIDNTQTSTPEETGGKMFTQDEVNKIVSDRLARERERLAGNDEYRAKYEAVQKELEGIKAAQLRQAKEKAYRLLLLDAGISEKRVPILLRASREEIDALELDEAGKVVNSSKVTETIKADWADFVVRTEIHGANTPNPPVHGNTPDDTQLRDAFKPKI